MAKHPVPKKKSPRTQSRRRYHAFANNVRTKLREGTQLTKCPSCGETVKAYNVCEACGKYRNEQIINKEKEMKKITKIKA